MQNRLTGILLPRKFPALCIWPFVLIRPSGNIPDMQLIIRHENIHARQQLEMAWILFFVWYILEFAIRLIVIRNYMKAYNYISFEREAHLNDHDPGYIRKRKPYAWISYLWR
jgi:hypothetical protein